MQPPRVITATDMSRNLSNLLNQVHYQGVTLEVKRGAEIIARVTPAQVSQGYPIERLDALLASLPRLAPGDQEAFLDDLHAAGTQLTNEGDAWDS